MAMAKKEARVSIPARRPEDQQYMDALDRLRDQLRDALNGRFVGGDVAWTILNRWDDMVAAEAEARRLTEGLRDLIKEAPEALDQNAVWVDDLLDLLAASPSDGGGECDKCGHAAHKPGDCPANVGTGYFGPVLCRCGVEGGGGAK